MKKSEFIAKLAALIKMDTAKLSELMTDTVKADDEVSVELPEGEFFTPEEISTRDKSQHDKGYKSGKKSGEEMLLDNLKETEGLEYEGKTKENFLAAIKTKYEGEKGKEVDQKIKDRDKRIAELTTSLTEKGQAFEKLSNEYSAFKSDFDFIEHLPDNRNPALTNQEWVARLKNKGIKIEEVEGKKVVRLGEDIVLDDKLKQPLPISSALQTIFTSNEGWLVEPAAGGSGGQRKGAGFGDKTKTDASGVYKSKKEFDAAMAEKGISYTNQAYQSELTAALKANPEMEMEDTV